MLYVSLLPDTLLTLEKLNLFQRRNMFSLLHLKPSDEVKIDLNGLERIRFAILIALMNEYQKSL